MPVRGVNLYDTYAATLHFNNQFFDYPAEKGSHNFASAIGAHLNNQFGMVADESKFWNNTFTNVARRVYFGHVPADAPTTRQDALKGITPWYAHFGNINYGLQWLDDGEKNVVVYDVDGSITVRVQFSKKSGLPETIEPPRNYCMPKLSNFTA